MRFHPAGQDMKVWAEAISDSAYSEYKSTVASLTAFGSTNGGTPASLSGVSAEFNADMDMFLVTIPSGQLPANGNNFFAKVDWAGIIDVKIEAYITDITTLAAINAEVDTAISDAAIVSKIDTVDTVVDGIATTLATPANFMADVSALATSAEITALSNIAAVGAERVIPASYITFDASESTITLASPYDTVTVEQVLSIRNLTKNMLLYDCTMTNRSSISIETGVITHTYSGTMADTDKLMIIVNKAE